MSVSKLLQYERNCGYSGSIPLTGEVILLADGTRGVCVYVRAFVHAVQPGFLQMARNFLTPRRTSGFQMSTLFCCVKQCESYY
jgi:hypothetical protein